MKKECIKHPKTYDLCARLNCDRPAALGYLTLLWDFTQDAAICGDVGKWPNGSIARACDWTGDPSEFVESMILAGWIDISKKHRLVIHDWPDHCERWVHLKLNKLKLAFVQPDIIEPTIERTIEATVEPSVNGIAGPSTDDTHTRARAQARRRVTEPNLAEPSRTKPSQTLSSPQGDGQLLEWIDWWNDLRAEGLVPHGVDRSPPSQAVVKAWKRSQSAKDLVPLLSDRPRIEAEIRASPFCQEDWFRLEKLLGGKNQDQEWIIRKLLDGGYRGRKSKHAIDGGRQYSSSALGFERDQ